MSIFKRRASGTRIPMRKHKGKKFTHVARFRTKREAKQYLRKDGKCDKYFYRLYKHKKHGYTVYLSFTPKQRYGGIRRRSKTGEGPHSK